jgi:uncharacterized membrane protein YbhN (UPF0104 family)
MQDTHETKPKTSILSEKLFLGFKWIVFVVILTVLFKTLQGKDQSIRELISDLRSISIRENALSMITVVLLIFFNWGFEAKKWQILARKIEYITFIDAYQSVLVGLSLGFITPAYMGDFAGRIMKLKSKNRSEGIGSILLGNGIQFYISILFGTFAYFIVPSRDLTFADKIIFWGLIFTLFLGIFVFFKRDKLTGILRRFSFLHKFQNHIKALTAFDLDEFKAVFFWATLRYLTFSLQFVIVLRVFEINIPIIDLWAVSCLVLLFKTIIPPINFLSDLGVREFSALHFFSLYSVNVSAVITATFALWLINILLPVLVGGGLFLKLKKQ